MDPCEDFYNFACGGFIQNKVIPDDKSKYSAFTELSDKLNEQVNAAPLVLFVLGIHEFTLGQRLIWVRI